MEISFGQSNEIPLYGGYYETPIKEIFEIRLENFFETPFEDYIRTYEILLEEFIENPF